MQFENYIQEQKHFLKKLFQDKEMELTDAISLLSQSLKQGEAFCWTCFQSYSHGFELFVIRNKTTGKWVGKAKEAFAQPENHVIVVEDWEEGELGLADQYNWVKDANNLQTVNEYLSFQGLLRHDYVKISGDIDQGIQVREQLIHFGEWLGMRLMLRDFDGLINRIYQHSSHSWLSFIDEFTLLDKKMGGFETYAVDSVSEVYSPEGGDQKVDGEMKLPKGVERNQRRGSVSIFLRSMLSPNGVPFFHTELQIDIIRDADQLLKITTYRFIET